MYRSALRSGASSLARAVPKQSTARRFISTAPPHEKSRSWKSSAARWGLAGALVYYYNTSSAFAEEPAYAIHAPPETARELETYPTIDAVAQQRRAEAERQAQSSQTGAATVAVPDASGVAADSPEGLEQEASQEGAFNEETGEINWDCPCLGGMAHGPCGEQFKAAFSCFVFSKDEPKGIDCIEHFKTMQNCFREHPDIYGAELDEDGAAPPEGEETPAPVPAPANTSADAQHGEKVAHTATPDPEHVTAGKRERAEAAAQQVKQDHGAMSESDAVIPKAAHDAR